MDGQDSAEARIIVTARRRLCSSLFLFLFILSYSAVCATMPPLSCSSFDDDEAQCMQPSLSCFYSLSDNTCIDVPPSCEERVGASLCNRGRPIQCWWNETLNACVFRNWTVCDSSSHSKPPFQCPENCTFIWDVAACVLVKTRHRMTQNLEHGWRYWCGYNPQHPLQWGVMTREQCSSWKSPWCSFRNSTGLCMPNRTPISPSPLLMRNMGRLHHLSSSSNNNNNNNNNDTGLATLALMRYIDDGGDDDNRDSGYNRDGYSVFDAMIIIISFLVLFFCLALCADATMHNDHEAYYENQMFKERMAAQQPFGSYRQRSMERS